MIIIAFPKILPRNVRAIALFPFIFLRKENDKNNPELINHEKIHIKQQIELLVIFFYLWYSIEYFIHYIRLKDSHLAYLSISFEKEAYFNQDDLGYLRNRKCWEFIRFLNFKKR